MAQQLPTPASWPGSRLREKRLPRPQEKSLGGRSYMPDFPHSLEKEPSEEKKMRVGRPGGRAGRPSLISY